MELADHRMPTGITGGNVLRKNGGQALEAGLRAVQVGFGDRAGAFLVGDSVWALIVKMTEPQAAQYFADRKALGFTTIFMDLFCGAQLSPQFGNANEVQVLTASYNPSLADFTDAATALGIVIVLSVLAMSVGLIRSETAPDLRTLTATGASGMTRRTITASTAAALGLLGAILGTAGAVIAGMAWTHSGLTATAGGVPPSDLLILLIGLPLVALVGGWLFAGREPPAVARRPLE